MKVGDYVRTNNGIILKIKEKRDIEILENHKNEDGFIYAIKYSNNIIDLIEVGDYVNGMKVISIEQIENGDVYVGFENKTYYQYVKSWNYESRITKYKIKSIVTKEQFESMQYKLGEDK